jgi:PAS domain S-box-containing protein
MKSVLKPTLKGTAFKVLLVEDNLAVAELIQELLQDAKEVTNPVTHVKRASEAIEALARDYFDVILLDLFLSDDQWLDTIVRLKEYSCQDKTQACPPIVVLGAIDDEELALQAIYAGAQDYLVKGEFESEQLIRSLRYAIARSGAPQAAIAKRDAIGAVERCAASITSSTRRHPTETLGQSKPNYHSVVARVTQVSFQSTLKQAEEALQQSEARLQRLTENVPGAIYQYRQYPDGTDEFTYVSPGIRDLHELEPEAVLESTQLMWASVHMDDLRALMSSIQHSAKTLEPWHAEWRIITPSGVLKWIRGAARPERQSDGTLIWDGILLDISDRKRVQEALQESEAKFRQLAEHIPQVFWMHSTDDGRVLYVSPAYERIWQRSSLSLSEDSNSWIDAIHPEDRERVLATLQYVSGESYKEYRILRPDGSIRWIGSHAFPIQNERDEVYRIAGIGEDITERKQAEEALKESERKFRAVFDSTLDAILIADNEGYYVDANPAACALLGLAKAQIVGLHVSTFSKPVEVDSQTSPLPSQDSSRLTSIQNTQNHWQQFLAQGHMRGEFRLHLTDGTTRDIEYSARANFLPNRHLSVFRDITDRKLAESALRQQKELLQTIFDHLPVMVVFSDAKGQPQLVNRELERVLGWSLEELGDRDLLVFCYPNPKYRAKVVDFIRTTTGQWQDFKTRTRDGRVLDTSWISIPLGDGTRIGIGQDVTERKRAEAALRSLSQQEREKALQLEQALNELQRTQAQLVQNEKMASLGQLLAGVAHEINNPTNFIYGNVTPAMEYASNLLELISLYQQHYPTPTAEIQDEIDAIELNFIREDFPKLLRSMQEGALRIQRIIKSLRNFSHINAAERKKVDLHQGLDSTLMILQTRLKQQANRAAIEVIKEYGDLPLVECYPGELNQVFMNILSNAIDAIEDRMKEDFSLTPQIRICTEVTRRNDQDSADKIVIGVADNGSGLPLNVQQRMFDPFFSTKPVGKGTGLGLSISHAIVVKKHNGKLYCNSQLGQGTEFAIELPLR